MQAQSRQVSISETDKFQNFFMLAKYDKEYRSNFNRISIVSTRSSMF